MDDSSILDHRSGEPVNPPQEGRAQRETDGAEPERERPVVLRGFGVALAFFAASRLLATLTIYATTAFVPGKTLTQAFLSWDGKWYFQLINEGYPHEHISGQGVDAQNTIAFFPLYPVLVRGVKFLTRLGTVKAAVFVAVAAGAVAICLLWLLAYRLCGVGAANRTVALYSFFPATFTMLMPYPESVMIALSIGCILSLLRERWILAGLSAALATAARPNAIVLTLCCLWAAAFAVWHKRDWKALAAPIFAPLGALAYFLFLWHHTGSARAWFDVQGEGWGYGNEMDRLSAVKTISQLWDHPLTDLNATMTAVTLIIALIGLGTLAWWRPPAVLSVLAVAICLMAFGIGGPASKMRYIMGAFPIAIAVAQWAKDDVRFALVIASSALGLGLYAGLATNTSLTIV